VFVVKTLLINPPWYCFQNRESHYVPVGLAYIAGALMASGHAVKILNGEELLIPHTLDPKIKVPPAFFHATERYIQYHNLAQPVWQVLGQAIAAESPDVVGVTMWSGAYQSAMNTCQVVKAYLPDAITVVGGIHPTLDPLSVIGQPHVDFVVCGEGEEVAVALWELFERDGDVHSQTVQIQGVWTRVDDDIHRGGKARRIENLDEIPFPNYETVSGNSSVGVLGLTTARGCVGKCLYCASKEMWGTKVRFRSVASCMDELAYYRSRFGLRWFRVNDDSFCMSKKRALAFCDQLVDRFGHTWGFDLDTRVDTLDTEIVDRLEWAGCTGISMGIESVVPRIQSFSHKVVDLEHARQMIAYINRSKITSGAYFMTGFPHETEKELEQSVRFMIETRPQTATWSVVTPYPGTELHRYAVERGIMPDVSLLHLMHHSLKTSMADIPEERHKVLLERILRICSRNKRRRQWYGVRPLLSRIKKAGMDVLGVSAGRAIR
jgi:anaerobic magnesium-protoporphyrin IX monomethyl ester cyclase